MKQPKEYRTYFGVDYEVQSYKGVELRKNPLTNLWMIFFIDPKKFPYSGTLKEIKETVDAFETREMLNVFRLY